jgi:hypothetical protein
MLKALQTKLLCKTHDYVDIIRKSQLLGTAHWIHHPTSTTSQTDNNAEWIDGDDWSLDEAYHPGRPP